ncbi:uncharacterized protein [Populus alba]|uniref:Transcription factor bHLH63-like n=1 Tax=Populus alba x Populus x berolinensis TaxID=444605 RepID=A0AAD6WF77_9ROSI|nr:transcription factor bHLH63-like [Populus alba x Populus x berolinensis]
MAAFPYQHQHLAFLVDGFQPNPNTKNDVSSLLLEQETIASGAIFSPNLTHEYLQESTLHAERILETIRGDENFSEKAHFTSSINYSSAIVNHNSSSPSMVIGLDYSEEDQVTQVMTPTMGQMRKQSLPTKKVKEESNREKRNPKSSVSTNLERERPTKRQKKAPPLEHPTGYVHVRARRGEATDRHSLAERVRRERISAKMKLLQSLVPGCDQITGKALILDEIVRYVQSLKDRVGSLEAELALVNEMVINDFKVSHNMETQAWQELFSSELQLPSDLESGSSQLSSFVETSDAPNSLLQPHLTYSQQTTF